MFFFKRPNLFLSYEEYIGKIRFMECFMFQQETRRLNIKNSKPIGVIYNE